MIETVQSALPDLAHFTGTETYWKTPLCPQFVYTDGVRYVAETAAAHWLITDIFLHARAAAALKGEEFQVWKLIVTDKATAELVAEDGNEHVLFSHSYDYTSFPREGITLWLVQRVLMLPSEY